MAISQTLELRPSADWFGIGFGIGWPLGGPSVAQGPPKRHAREAQASNGVSAFVCNERCRKAGVGAKNLVIGGSHVIW
jgi:hypothetical protein